MKRIFVLLLITTIVLLSVLPVSALEFRVEEIENDLEPLLPSLGHNCYLTKINGEEYFIKRNSAHDPIKYEKREFDFFSHTEKGKDYLIYIWTGEYYYAKNTLYDEAPVNLTMSALTWGDGINHVGLFDRDFNLIKEHSFEFYAIDIDYKDGEYYCYSVSSDGRDTMHYFKSYDFENWEEIKEPLPKKNGDIWYRNEQVSFDGIHFYDIKYENNRNKNEMYFKDMMTIKSFNQVCLSKDNVYFIPLNLPLPEKEVDDGIMTFNGVSINYFYETENEYVIDTTATGQRWDGPGGVEAARKKSLAPLLDIRYKISKQLVNDELNHLQNSVYVQLNDTILGFAQPPTMESDRTLVPMRFLFEQLGAEVDWDNNTQTAVATKGKNEIRFSIDSTAAKVDGATKTMDVPARLVNDKTMVPLRFLSENLGYAVDWDEDTRIATIMPPQIVTGSQTGVVEMWNWVKSFIGW